MTVCLDLDWALSIFSLALTLTYDSSWYNKFGSDSVQAMRRVVAQAQNLLYWPSLTTKFTLKIKEERAATFASWTADKSM